MADKMAGIRCPLPSDAKDITTTKGRRKERDFHVDYERLKWILAERVRKNEEEGEEEAHKFFMRHYGSAIVRPTLRCLDEPTNVEKRMMMRKKNKEINASSDFNEEENSMQIGFRNSLSLPPLPLTFGGDDLTQLSAATLGHVTHPSRFPPILPPKEEESLTHDIRDWLPLLHNSKKHIDPVRLREQKLKGIKRILHKMRFERTAADVDEIHEGLKLFPILTKQVSPAVLRELCVVAQIDEWQEADITIFGTTGFHIILRGSVTPYAIPFVKTQTNSHEFEAPTPEPSEVVGELRVGDCFGSLTRLEDRAANSRILSVVTNEPNCEFLKITTSDFASVQEQIIQRERAAKMNLVQSCESYQMWPKQPVTKLASLLEWVSFPANTVVVKEGRRCPFLAFIRSGECHVIKKLTGKERINGQKQVVIGKLSKGQSFGEISTLMKTPAEFSVVSASDVDLGVVKSDKLHDLDEITKNLLSQTSSAILKDMSKEKIHAVFIQQELDREWNEFKMSLVNQVIDKKLSSKR